MRRHARRRGCSGLLPAAAGSHALKGQLDIRIFDPNGREYVVRSVNPNDGGAFRSVARSFYHDAPLVPGRWTLAVRDTVAGTAGVLKEWKMYFY